jgi:tetratricopeptide (TPR) repeat protein
MQTIKLIIRVVLVSTTILISSCKQKSEEQVNTAETKKDELTLLNQKIAANPTAELYFNRAQIFASRNVLTQALEDMDRAISLDSSRTDFFMFQADLSFRTLQIQNSVRQFEKVLKLDPLNIEANLKLAEIYLYTKGYQKCLHYADEALKLDKNKGKAYFLKGFAFKEIGDTAHALSSFQTVVEVEPQNYDAYIQLGNIQAARKNKIALQYYNTALRLSPKSTEALYNRGLAYQNMGELAKAKEDYKLILSIDRNFADAHYNLGYIALVFEKDYPAAITYFTDAIRVNSSYAEAFYNRGVAYELSGNNEAAQKDYHGALKIIPTFKLALKKLKK